MRGEKKQKKQPNKQKQNITKQSDAEKEGN